MNDKNKTRFFVYSIALLILLNLTTIAMFWIEKNKASCNNNIQGERGAGSFLIEQLKFNNEQTQKFKELRREHQQIVRPLMDSIRLLKEDYFDLINIEQIDTSKLIEFSLLITEKHRRVDIATFYHFKKIREICNNEQRQKFNDIIKDGLLAPPTEKGPMRHLRN